MISLWPLTIVFAKLMIHFSLFHLLANLTLSLDVGINFCWVSSFNCHLKSNFCLCLDIWQSVLYLQKLKIIIKRKSLPRASREMNACHFRRKSSKSNYVLKFFCCGYCIFLNIQPGEHYILQIVFILLIFLTDFKGIVSCSKVGFGEQKMTFNTLFIWENVFIKTGS